VTASEMVLEFHETYGVVVGAPDTYPLRDLRSKLLMEEAMELDEELMLEPGSNMERVAKELADLVYVAYGTALSFGIDLDRALALVHASNMSKLGPDGKPVLREDGKVLKGPGYFEPDMRSAVMGDAA
jgi:NTP pyrophosphatase (non-canonical NTP hydrolase)